MRTSEHSSSRYLPAISGPSGMVPLNDLLGKDIFGAGFVLGIITCDLTERIQNGEKRKRYVWNYA